MLINSPASRPRHRHSRRTEAMMDTSEQKHLTKMARFNQWSRAFPNARLALCGFVLLLLAVGLTCIIGLLANPVFDGTIYRASPLEKSPLWRLLEPSIGLSLEVAIIGGITTIVFAAYRTVRDRLRRPGIK
jgi:hypothetical protein